MEASLELGKYRGMLRDVVEQVSHKYRAKFDESDIVQQTMLDACENLHNFRGKSDAELTSWLRTMLCRNLLDAIRQLRSQKRDVAKEINLNAEASNSRRPAGFAVSAETTSPSLVVARSEELNYMRAAISRLPAQQGEAILLHHINGWSLAEVAQHMQRSAGAVAGLLHRGLRTLKSEIRELQ